MLSIASKLLVGNRAESLGIVVGVVFATLLIAGQVEVVLHAAE